MKDYRKYACEISGILFKEVNKKGIRRDRLAKELSISENQIKNYAYDSTKSATLENFLQVLINHKCNAVLGVIASEMGYGIYRLPESLPVGTTSTDTAAEALIQSSRAVQSSIQKSPSLEKDIRSALEKLLTLYEMSKN